MTKAAKNKNQLFKGANIFLFILLIAGVVVYLGISNSKARDRFEIEKLSKELYGLKQANAALEIEASEVASLSGLREKGENIGLEQSKNVKYIEVKEKDPLVFNN